MAETKTKKKITRAKKPKPAKPQDKVVESGFGHNPHAEAAMAEGVKFPRGATAMPHILPGRILDFKAMYDADNDAEDIWSLIERDDNHKTQLWHSWWRRGVGWNGPELVHSQG